MSNQSDFTKVDIASQDLEYTPTISIIIPCYNSSAFIPRAIDNVLAQTWTDFELLIVDDGSTDESFKIISQYANRDPRIKIIRHEHNRGLPAARNTGIRQARGMLIAFLDADDWWSPEKLATQVPIFDNPAIGACCLSSILVYQDSQTILKAPQTFLDPDTLYKTLLYRNAIPGSASSMIVRRKCFDILGLFNESMIAAEDHDMWIRLAAQYSIQWIDSAFVFIDKSHSSSMTKNVTRMAKGREQFLHNRERDIRPEFRSLLPDAWRYAHIHSAIEFLRVDNLSGARGYARKAITASFHIDRELRRAFVLLFLSCIPLPFQQRFLRPLRRRVLKTD